MILYININRLKHVFYLFKIRLIALLCWLTALSVCVFFSYSSRRGRSASGRRCVWSRWVQAGCSHLPSSASSSPFSLSSFCGSRCRAGPCCPPPAQALCVTDTEAAAWEMRKQRLRSHRLGLAQVRVAGCRQGAQWGLKTEVLPLIHDLMS